jgi:hypothetical protein
LKHFGNDELFLLKEELIFSTFSIFKEDFFSSVGKIYFSGLYYSENLYFDGKVFNEILISPSSIVLSFGFSKET